LLFAYSTYSVWSLKKEAVTIMKQARIVLSPIESTDLPQVFLGFSSSPVTRYYGLSYDTLDDCREQMNWYEQIIRDESGRWLAIRSVLDGRFMGAIGYHDYDPIHCCAELGYWLLPDFWGQGLMQEAAQDFLLQTYRNTKINRLYAEVEEPNLASQRLLQRCGFVLEGLSRECEFKDGRFISLYQYARLRSDFIEANIQQGLDLVAST
jgi:[ribosomal protein S5]-alanine N-acetyltransferase